MSRKNLIKLSFGHAVTDINAGALPIMLAYLQPVFALTHLQAGMVVMAFNITSSVIQPAFGVFSDRRRMAWMMPAGCLLAGLGMFLSGISPNFEILLLSVLLSGLGVAAFHPEASKFARLSSGPRKVSGMALFSVGGNVGVALGPVLATLFYSLAGLGGTVGFLAVCAVMALVLRLTLPFYGPAAGEADGGQASGPSGKAPPLPAGALVPLVIILLIVTFRSWVNFGILTFVPQYYIYQLNSSPAYATLINFLFLAAGAVGTLLGGPVADRWGMKSVLMGSMALQIPLLYMFLHLGGIWALASVTLAGLALVSTFAVTLVYGQELMPGRVGLASGLIIGFGVGMGGVGTPLIGYVADHWGMATALNSLLALPAAGLVLAALLPREAVAEREAAVLESGDKKSDTLT